MDVPSNGNIHDAGISTNACNGFSSQVKNQKLWTFMFINSLFSISISKTFVIAQVRLKDIAHYKEHFYVQDELFRHTHSLQILLVSDLPRNARSTRFLKF